MIKSVFLDTTYTKDDVLTTKKSLGDAYNMKPASEAGKEWYEQVNLLEAKVVENQNITFISLNEDGKTVAAVDLEVPGAGELMGGSQREEDYDKLIERMNELNVDKQPVDWFLNLRKYGGCVHSGFGMGFERLIIYLTGVENIRDVIPFPRTPGNCEF